MRGRAKKTGPAKKEWQVGRDNDSRSRRPRTAAPGHGGGWCRRAEPAARPGGLRAALARLTRAGQHYYSHLGLRPPSFDYQPLIREGPNDYMLRNGQKKLVRSLQGGERRLTKLGKGFFRDKTTSTWSTCGGHPGQAAQRTERGRDWLPVNELGGARGTRRTSRRSRWRSGSDNKWRPRWTRTAHPAALGRPTSLP